MEDARQGCERKQCCSVVVMASIQRRLHASHRFSILCSRHFPLLFFAEAGLTKSCLPLRVTARDFDLESPAVVASFLGS